MTDAGQPAIELEAEPDELGRHGLGGVYDGNAAPFVEPVAAR